MRNPFRYFNSSHPAIRRAGRLGDGWLIEVFRVAAADAQRDPAALGIDATVYLNDGDIEGWTKEAEAWSSLGLPQSFRISDTGSGKIDQHIDAMDRLMSGYATS